MEKGILPRRLTFSEKLLSVAIRCLPIKHGKHRILDKTFPRAWHRPDVPVQIFLRGVGNITVDVSDLVGWHFAVARSFDPEVAEVLTAGCDEEKIEVFWDIGANKGACSIAMARAIPGIRIVAIEPQALLRGINMQNLEVVCGGRFEYRGVAMGVESGVATLTIPSDNTGRASLHATGSRHAIRTETVQIMSATEIRSESSFGDPTVVKIDVEGHEASVLESLRVFFANGSVKVLVFENHIGDAGAFALAMDLAAQFDYRVFGIKKTVFATRLIPASGHLPGVNDYAIVRENVTAEYPAMRKLVR